MLRHPRPGGRAFPRRGGRGFQRRHPRGPAKNRGLRAVPGRNLSLPGGHDPAGGPADGHLQDHRRPPGEKRRRRGGGGRALRGALPLHGQEGRAERRVPPRPGHPHAEAPPGGGGGLCEAGHHRAGTAWSHGVYPGGRRHGHCHLPGAHHGGL